jgi:hypothetical protein
MGTAQASDMSRLEQIYESTLAEDPLEVLGKLKQLEADLEDLYRHFAKVYSIDHEASELFARLSGEEKVHKQLVDKQIEYVEMHPDAEIEIQLAGDALDDLLADIARLRATHPPPRLDESVSSALMFEFVTEEAYVGRLVKDASPEILSLIDTLTRASGKHHEHLKEFALRRKMLVVATGA